MELSVILPVYNVEKYVKECIDSILCQEFMDFELIIIDDGSTDNTKKVIDSYSDNRIRYFFQDNSGLSYARNKGLSQAQGEFIIFIDSDDIINPKLFKECLSITRNKGLDLLFFGFQMFSSNSGERIFGEKRTPNIQRIVGPEEGLKELFKDNIPHFAWANMTRRSIFVRNSITFPVNRNYEDFATTYKLIYYSEKIGFLKTNDYLYRQRNSSIMHQASDKEAKDILSSEREIIDFIDRKKPMIIGYACNYVIRRLFDGWVYAIKNKNDELIYTIEKEIIRIHRLSDKRNLSRKIQIKYCLFRLNLLKLAYTLKRGL